LLRWSIVHARHARRHLAARRNATEQPRPSYTRAMHAWGPTDRCPTQRRVGAATSPRVATEPRRRGLEQPHRLSQDGAFAASPTTSSALTRPAVGGSHRPNSYKRRVGRNRCTQSAAHHRAMTGEVAIVLAASSSRPAERSRPTAAGRAGRRRRATPRSHVRIAERAARRGRERAGIVGRPRGARRSGTCRSKSDSVPVARSSTITISGGRVEIVTPTRRVTGRGCRTPPLQFA